MTTDLLRRAALFLSGMMGAGGVALAAAANHTGATHMLGNASAMCLAHAPILLGIYLGWSRIKTAAPAVILLGLGTLLFAGDLVSRQFTGNGLFPMAAPAGGLGMMLGWIVLSCAAFFKTAHRDL
ncbi:DUF423 domain-containing protein [Rhizobium sp. Leaf262]|uniref:DUF423 domain-containing protein n=1 Tax=Rhizobium sp. Leaf262 TaxID=1736312 RepID=UPI000712381C|nr:DUF423 domain-containing protein [Rhizobium sp. Leaf262]KQO75565.1 hypothetical protein ASF29_10075 [Rhizobium sp. Leaf262]